MRNILVAILLVASSSALFTGCTDDLAMDQRDIEAQPLDETSAAGRPELAAQSDDAVAADRHALAEGTSTTNTIPCPTPANRVSPISAMPKEDAVADEGTDFCGELPSEGPCSLACDPDALIDQYVPHGQCVTYRCELKSGEVFRTGGCNP